MIEPMKAAVRPRVHLGSARGAVLLEDLVAEEVSSGNATVIQLFAPPASGVTTALRHIAFHFGTIPDLALAELDRPALFYNQRPAGLIAFRRSQEDAVPVTIDCTLAGWERDEWIEYLLGVHGSKCASAMKRIQHDADRHSLGNNSNILRQVLDELAADDQLPNVESALKRIVARHFPDTEQRQATARRILLRLFRRSAPRDDLAKIQSPEHSVDQLRLLYVPAVLMSLASELAWCWLNDDIADTQWFDGWTRELVTVVARKVSASPAVQKTLQSWLCRDDHARHPLAVSLLHLANVPWEWPSPDVFSSTVSWLNLEEAVLDGADCTRMPLAKCKMPRASLVGAKLSGVNLKGVNANGTSFAEANLESAFLDGLTGFAAQFSQANLSGVKGQCMDLKCADLSFARFHDARLDFSSFCDANLSGADLGRASLRHCIFREAQVTDANFQYANLERADFRGCDLSVADFRHASFRWTRLYACHMAGMELSGADFESACLEEAELTGSIMPRANFRGANLRLAKLAEVEWEFVDLRYADLRNATFHMGSSRSGLVSSSIPMEGSKTGFYSDEWNEQDFKSPEEIRKANLRGADLRGAAIDGVDFYLVDLRDALYDDDQLDQLRSTGAIL